MASHSSAGAARQHSRILFVKNLNYSTTGADLYHVFGRYGAIRQLRLGDAPKTKGTAYVVYEEMADAKRALDNLNGFHLNERYIVGKSPTHPLVQTVHSVALRRAKVDSTLFTRNTSGWR